jgi:thiamine kinase-like enzyme
MKPLSDDIRYALPFDAFLNDLGCLGIEPVAQGGQRYAVIAARSNLRWWLLPLDSRPAAAAGLDMLQPVTGAAKLAKMAARGLALLGPHALLGCGHLRLSRLPDLDETFDGRATHMAFFTGTDGPHRKTSMQIMDIDGAILGYAKMSRALHLRPYLRNEANVLTRLKELGLTSVDVPTVQVIHDDDEMTLLITDSLKSSSHSVPLHPGIEHLFFLNELRAKTERLGAGEVLDGLERRMVELASVGGTDWTKRIASVTALLRPVQDQIPVCLAHGDFTPWNTFLQDGRLYVFDWEYANLAWPVGFDLAHFILATIPPDQQPDSLADLLSKISHEHFSGNKAAAWRSLILSLSCHAVFYLRRLLEAESSMSDWIEGPTRAVMLDRLLAQRDTLT